MRHTGALLLLIAFALVMLSCSDKKEDKSSQEQTQSDQSTSTMSVAESLAALRFDTSSSTASGKDLTLIGTWHYSNGQQLADITYKPDGTFAADSRYGEQLMNFYGTYRFDGTKLTSTVTKVVAVDTTDKEGVKDANRLNSQIEEDPSKLSATAEIQFTNSNEFISIAKDGSSSTYTRIK